MWDEPLPPKPFYRRAWFLTLVALFVLSVLTGAGGWFYVDEVYGGKAATFDLSKLQQMESASIVYDRNGQLLGKIYVQNRETISINEMPYNLIQALVAAEDNRFFEHHGIDFVGMGRAMMKNWKAGRIRQGASTVTQQLARNSFPEELPSSDRSFHRKLLEAFVAWRIEKQYTKQQILEFYLNRVYFGSGFYGVESAARGYFGKSAKDLTISECAMLTSLLKSPNNLSPWKNRQACVEARDFVLGRMQELGMIDQATHDKCVAEKLPIKNRTNTNSDSYAVEYIRQQVAGLIGDKDSVYGDGFRIYTTIDANLQRTAETALKRELEDVEHRRGYDHQTYAQYDNMYRNRRKRADNDPLPGPAYLQGAVYALDNSTGGILVLVGGRDFKHNQYNRALLSNRPAGTGFIPIVYAAAFEKGIFPGAIFQDAVMDNRLVMIGGRTGIMGEWGPESEDNQYEGPISAHYALVKSKNAATVRLGMATGIDNVLKLAKKAGIDNELRHFPATYLGSSEVTLADMTLAYTMFPNGGSRPVKPFVIQRVEEPNGHILFEAPALHQVQVIKPTTAYEVHSALADALDWGTAERAYTRYGLKKFPLGGKTGTAYNFTDVWFLGYSSAITCGVWAGFDSPQQIYRGAFSKDIALPIWVNIMNASFQKFDPKPIKRPPGLKRYEICRSSGLLATDRCYETRTIPSTGAVVQESTTFSEWGTPEQAPKEMCDVHGENAKAHVKQIGPPQDPAVPRAELAVDVNSFKPVNVRSQTIEGNDPFNAVTNTHVERAEPVDANGVPLAEPIATPTPTPPPEPPVLRAEPVRAGDVPSEQSTIKLDAPPPVDFQ